MLKFFSRLERTRNFVLIVFAVIMALSLVLFYAPHNTQPVDLTGSNETAAKVGSSKITVGDIAAINKQYGGRGSADQILKILIPARIIRAEAERLGLTATDAEVADFIREQNKSADGTPIDQATYERNAIEQAGSVKAYEQAIRDQLSGQKLQAFITSGVTVSEDEVLNDFKRKNTKFDLSYVPVNTGDLAQNIKPSDEDLKNYFEQNKKSYYISLPEKNIRYIFVNTAKLGEKMQISDADLKAEYDKLPDDKKQAGVTGQQIVLHVPKPELDAQILAKANEIVANARKDGGKISEEDFGNLAKGQSEDVRTASSGGTIPGVVRPNPNNPTETYQKLLTLEEGQVTDPIKVGASYYILRRGASVPKTFEDAKKEIEVSLRNRRGYTAAVELAQKIDDELKQNKDAQKTAQDFAAQVNSNVKDMVRETGFVKPGDNVENIGISPQFEDGIASLENAGDVGGKIPVKDGFAIPILVAKRDPHDATFDEVKDHVTAAYKQSQAQKQVEQVAKDIASGAGSAANLAAVAQSKGLKAQDSKNFILGSPLGQGANAATSQALEDAIYNLHAGEVTKTPIKVGDNYYVVGVTNRTEADIAEFAKERDQLVETLLEQKRGEVFADYFSDVRQKMEADGQIKIYDDVLKNLDSANGKETDTEN
ncbi:MAG: peptidyl-prolyl cis-trans isomerase [Pyrinomonadaceae bacterium]